MTLPLEQQTEEMLENLREGCWIGEDGGAACLAQIKRQGLFKIKDLMRRDCGEVEARALKLADIGVGWARLATPRGKG
jgi:hypothetical protein